MNILTKLKSVFNKAENVVSILEKRDIPKEKGVIKEITFDEIQNTIKDEIFLSNEKIKEIDENNLKIQELNSKIESFKELNKDVYSKIEKLKSLGLVNTPSSVYVSHELSGELKNYNNEIYNLKEEINKLKRLNNLIQKYKLEYPSYKFIDKDTFIKILKKYNLVLGASSLYANEIPENVLDNILKFKHKIQTIGSKYIYKISRFRGEIEYRITDIEISITKYNHHDDFNKLFQYERSNLLIAAPINHFVNPLIEVQQVSSRGYTHHEVSPLMINPTTRELVIDLHFFKTLNEKNKEMFMKINDPIACLEVEDGYIIIDAWEKEAEIPEINRENLN